MTTEPRSLRVWDNSARLGLQPLLKAWLLFLVLAFLAAGCFVYTHVPARWVLGGFVLSHVIVFVLSVAKNYVLRHGMVSLLHVVCWAPGLVFSMLDIEGRQDWGTYRIWSYTITAVIIVAFIFDIRDASRYLYSLSRAIH
ncbi:MAG: hypothetical protein ACI9G1_000967 [Pirellulaceae bacterium]|jgi:hypothetical protein